MHLPPQENAERKGPRLHSLPGSTLLGPWQVPNNHLVKLNGGFWMMLIWMHVSVRKGSVLLFS